MESREHACESTVTRLGAVCVCVCVLHYVLCAPLYAHVVMHDLFVSASSLNTVIKRPQSVLIRREMYCGCRGKSCIATDNVAQYGWSSTARS